MNPAPRPLPALALAALLAAALPAQSPENAPPWWRVQDNVTVSLYWSFDAPFAQGTFPPPTLAVVPPWYSPAVTAGVASGNLGRIPTLAGHVGVLGITGTGTPQAATLDLTVDNDPYPDWIKVFWFQFDVFEGSSGSVVAKIEESLLYQRATVTEVQKPIPLGNGWERVTMSAQLIPQPDDEGIDFTFLENGNGTVAIDNLFVNSKCVKPEPDETGGALGEVLARIDLTTTTGGADCQGVAVTEGPAPAFPRQYWLSVRAATTGVAHSLLRLSATPPFVVLGSTPLGANLATAPLGPGDLAVQTVASGGTTIQQVVWVVFDRRAAGLGVLLQGVDAATSAVQNRALTGFPPLAVLPTQPFGLAFDPSGELGGGSFWISGTGSTGQGALLEFSLATGALIDSRSLEPECTGLGYDDTLGNFYAWSRALQPSPTGPVAASGFELSAFDFQPTGVRFCGDLLQPNGGGPRGGFARGFEVWRSRSAPTSQLNLVCLVDTPGNPLQQQALYELAGPFRFGWSLLGRCGMRDAGPFRGLPFLGSTLQVDLTGVPHSLFALLFLGFSNQASGVGQLPLPLSTLLGWPESVLSVSPDVSTAAVPPAAPGEFVFPVAIPATPALAYTPVFFQWLALDSGVPGFFAMSQAGKTVLYP